MYGPLVIVGMTVLALLVMLAGETFRLYAANKRQIWEPCSLSPYVVGAPVNKFRGVVEIAVGFPQDWDQVVPFLVGYRDKNRQEWLCSSHKVKAYRVLMEVGDAHAEVFAVDAKTRRQIVVRLVGCYPRVVGQFRFKHSRTAE